MSSRHRAELMVARAHRWLADAEAALGGKRFDDAVYLAQMAVEAAVKAVLFALGVDYPREHDVSSVLLQLRENPDLPSWFRDVVPEVAGTVHRLAQSRGLAAYSYEHGLTLDAFAKEAPDLIQRARRVCDVSSRLLKALFR